MCCCVDGLSLPAKPLHSGVIVDTTTTRKPFDIRTLPSPSCCAVSMSIPW
jgi:hypothetical protein